MDFQAVRQNLRLDAHLKEAAFFLNLLYQTIKATECCKSRSREPIHKREFKLEVPQSPVKVQKRKPTKSVSKTPVQRIDTKTMDDYRKVVQSNIKSCKNLLAKQKFKLINKVC